jgi:hypothetical protein
MHADNPKIFRSFPKSAQTNAGIDLEMGQNPLPSTSFPIHYTLIIQISDAMWSELLTAKLNKPQIHVMSCDVTENLDIYDKNRITTSEPTCTRAWIPDHNYWTLVWFKIIRESSVVGWGSILQADRSRVEFLMRSLDFSIDLSFQPNYGPDVDSASNRNEYQESSWG